MTGGAVAGDAPSDGEHVESASGVPGVAVAVLGNWRSTQTWRGAVSAGGVPVDETTTWEAASLTKPVVALLALDLSIGDADFLDRPLDVNPSEVGAADDGRWSDVSVRHLLLHTAGFPNWREPGQPLRFATDPGNHDYSGEGFEVLLAELCSRTGRSSEDLLSGWIRRLGMAQSSFVFEPEGRAAVAIGHDDAGAELAKVAAPVPRASGSLHTTLADYARFVAVVLGDVSDGAPAEAGALMHRPMFEQSPNHGRTHGWTYSESEAGTVLWQHGDNPGFKHVAALRPATGDAVVVFTNTDAGQEIYRPEVKGLLGVDVW